MYLYGISAICANLLILDAQRICDKGRGFGNFAVCVEGGNRKAAMQLA